ncbi:hypothetical protein EJB05_16322, partial [Eragrostis curvula]
MLNLCLLASWIARLYKQDETLWKRIVENKYDLEHKNIFCCDKRGVSPFWKGIIWAAEAAKLGFKWKVGNGKRIRFWEDWWFGTSSLAIQFWELYVIVNEQNSSIDDVWDGSNLKLTFRRTVNEKGMMAWNDLLAVASSIDLGQEDDYVTWALEASGKYTVQSLYSVVSFRGKDMEQDSGAGDDNAEDDEKMEVTMQGGRRSKAGAGHWSLGGKDHEEIYSPANGMVAEWGRAKHAGPAIGPRGGIDDSEWEI